MKTFDTAVIRQNNSIGSKTSDLALIALFSALIAVGAFIKIPIPPVPMTLQLMFVVMAGQLLGAKKGALSVLCYIALGLIGIPVFTSGGGITYILKPTFGYIIGFVFAAYAVGKLTDKNGKSYWKMLAVSMIGIAVIYAFGLVYFFIISRFYLASTMSIWKMLLYCCIVFLPGDIISCALCTYVSKRTIKVFRK